LIGSQRGAEDPGGERRDLFLLVAQGATGHRGGGPDQLEVRGAGCLLEPTHQEGHIGALPTPIRMQFVENEEFQAAEQRQQPPALLGTGEHQFQHDEVGQQDVRLDALQNLVPALLRLLPGVEGMSHLAGASRSSCVQVALQLLDLAVGQRIHRVDDDRSGLLRLRVPQHVIHDGHDVTHALTRPGAGRQNVALALLGEIDSVPLVPMKEQRSALGILRRTPTEDRRRVGMQDS
jgi:hypothetical protein